MNNSQTLIQSALGDKYEIKRLIQSGGMGEIFLGVHKALERKVAIKIIHQELVKSESIRSRFHREAKLAASLVHPGIINIYDFGSSSDFDYLIMPFIDGENLQERIAKNGPFEPAESVRVMIEIAEALHFAHSHHVIHRDIKPPNIMFDSQDKVIITDFGISKDMGDSDITAPNTVMGSPRYMSPEQITGTAVDARSDLYSLGLVFYEMLAGSHPFKGRNTTALYYAQVHESPPRPDTLRPDIPMALGRIIMKLLQKNANNRYADGALLLKDLRDYQRGKFTASSGGEDDDFLINDTILINGASLINDASLIVNTIIVDAGIPDQNLLKPSSSFAPSPTAATDCPAVPAPLSPSQGFFRQHIKARAWVGLALLVIIFGIAFFSGGLPGKKQTGQTMVRKNAPNTLKQLSSKQPSPTLYALIDLPVASLIAEGLNPSSGHSEQSKTAAISNPKTIEQPEPKRPAPKSLIDAIMAVSGGKTAGQFSLWTNSKTYRIGETISFHFKSIKSCYAVILAYNTKKELVQIYPNHYMHSQLIHANREYTIPDDNMGFDLEVGEPTGQETLIAMISDKPFQLFGSAYTTNQPFITVNERDAAQKERLYNTLSAIKSPHISQQRLTYLITD